MSNERYARMRASLRVPTFLAAVAAVTLTACTTEADGISTPPAQSDALPVLVTAEAPQEAYVSNLGRGLLTVDSRGCLRHGSAFVIWPHGSAIAQTADRQLQVTDGATRKTVLVGQEIGMSGTASDDLPDASRLAQAIPEQCGRPYKWGGSVMTEAELRALDERDRNRVPVPPPPESKDTLR